jgi:hypothetical protein
MMSPKKQWIAALKGGTAINLMVFALPRLSVDYCFGKT